METLVKRFQMALAKKKKKKHYYCVVHIILCIIICTELLYFHEKVKRADFHLSMAEVPKLFTIVMFPSQSRGHEGS